MPILRHVREFQIDAVREVGPVSSGLAHVPCAVCDEEISTKPWGIAHQFADGNPKLYARSYRLCNTHLLEAQKLLADAKDPPLLLPCDAESLACWSLRAALISKRVAYRLTSKHPIVFGVIIEVELTDCSHVQIYVRSDAGVLYGCELGDLVYPVSPGDVTVQGVVRVEQLVDTLSDGADRQAKPAGVHGNGSVVDYRLLVSYEQTRGPDWRNDVGETEAETAILDEFHRTIPIGCLDDFKFTVLSVTPIEDAPTKPQEEL